MNGLGKKKLLILFVIPVFIFLLILLVGKLSNLPSNATIAITISDEAALPVSIFNKSGFVAVQSKEFFVLNYTEKDFLFKFVSIDGITTEFYDLRQSEELEVVFSSQPIKEISLAIIEDRFKESRLQLKTLKTYGDGNWAIASAVTQDYDSDGSIGIYSFFSEAYVEVFSGTGPDLSTLLDAGIPEAVALNILEDYSVFSQRY